LEKFGLLKKLLVEGEIDLSLLNRIKAILSERSFSPENMVSLIKGFIIDTFGVALQKIEDNLKRKCDALNDIIVSVDGDL